jgi:hypothetical protein
MKVVPSSVVILLPVLPDVPLLFDVPPDVPPALDEPLLPLEELVSELPPFLVNRMATTTPAAMAKIARIVIPIHISLLRFFVF